MGRSLSALAADWADPLFRPCMYSQSKSATVYAQVCEPLPNPVWNRNDTANDAKQPDSWILTTIYERKDYGAFCHLFVPGPGHCNIWAMKCPSDLQANDEQGTVDSAPEWAPDDPALPSVFRQSQWWNSLCRSLTRPFFLVRWVNYGAFWCAGSAYCAKSCAPKSETPLTSWCHCRKSPLSPMETIDLFPPDQR